MDMLRAVAERRGLIVLTDSDGAGLVIRNRLRGSIDERFLKHAYIPARPGKERRKSRPSREGTLGVEGMEPEILEQALLRAGAEREDTDMPRLTKADLYALGLNGTKDAALRRKQLQRRLNLPENLSSNGLLDALNSLYTPEEVSAAARSLQEQCGEIADEQDSQGI